MASRIADNPVLNEIARVLDHGCQLRVHSEGGIFYGTFTSWIGEEEYVGESFTEIVHQAYVRAVELGPDPTPKRKI